MEGETFLLEISMGNAAMQDDADVAYALHNVAERLERGNRAGKIMDANGNTVGTFTFLSGVPEAANA